MPTSAARQVGIGGAWKRASGKAKGWTIAIPLIVILVVISYATKSDSHKSPADKASGFVSKIQQDSSATSTSMTGLLAELNATDGSYAELTEIASDSDDLHGHLSDFYHQVLTSADLNNTMQYAVVNDAEELEHAVGAVHKWTGDPSASNNASWQDQMAKGVSGWNVDVRQLWKSAGISHPPTITIPS